MLINGLMDAKLKELFCTNFLDRNLYGRARASRFILFWQTDRMTNFIFDQSIGI